MPPVRLGVALSRLRRVRIRQLIACAAIAMMGSFAQRYVKRHGLAQPFQADFEGLFGYGQGEHPQRAVLPILTS